MRERVNDKLLQPAEVGRRCADFKDGWYSIARKIDLIAEFTSEEGEALRRTLESIAKGAKRLRGELQVLARSVKRYKPGVREDVDVRMQKVDEGLSVLCARAEGEVENLSRFTRVTEEVSALRKEIEKIDAELREVEGKVATLCTKFFERKRELKLARDKIKARVEKGIYDLQKKFEEKLSGIAGEYELRLDGEPVTLRGLFEELLRNLEVLEKVELRPAGASRSFLGMVLKREELDEGARLEVLRFIARELVEEARRIREAELEKARCLSREFADLDALEKACRDVERRREELTDYRRELEERISQLESTLNRNFDDYNEILSLKEELTSIFDAADEEVRGFLEYVAAAMDGVEIERDPEKRRLLARVKELEAEVQRRTSQIEKMAEERDELVREISELRAELERRLGELQELRRKNSELFSALSEAEQRTAELEREKRALGAELEQLGAEISELRDVREQLSGEKAALEAELEKERKKSAELQEELSKLREEVEKALTEVLEKVGSK